MKILEKIKNYLHLFSLKLERNKAIHICIKNNIPLTDQNIKEVTDILKQEEYKI